MTPLARKVLASLRPGFNCHGLFECRVQGRVERPGLAHAGDVPAVVFEAEGFFEGLRSDGAIGGVDQICSSASDRAS